MLYKCLRCGKEFKKKYDLNRHINKKNKCKSSKIVVDNDIGKDSLLFCKTKNEVFMELIKAATRQNILLFNPNTLDEDINNITWIYMAMKEKNLEKSIKKLFDVYFLGKNKNLAFLIEKDKIIMKNIIDKTCTKIKIDFVVKKLVKFSNESYNKNFRFNRLFPMGSDHEKNFIFIVRKGLKNTDYLSNLLFNHIRSYDKIMRPHFYEEHSSN
jgi:DNA-directed RNA polymerase subunit RPC12/RpoP